MVGPAPKSSAATLSSVSKLQSWFTRGYRRGWWQIAAASSWLLLVAAATSLDLRLVQLWDRQIQTLFFELRGVQTPPDDIIILTIDDESMAQAEHFLADPQKHAALEPIQQWPWQRSAYAIAIERLVGAGAKVVGLDVLLTTESAYGRADDQRLAQALAKHGDRVVLGATLGNTQLNQGSIMRPNLPIPLLLNTPAHTGLIQFPIEVDGRIHRQSGEYIKDLARIDEALGSTGEIDSGIGLAAAFPKAFWQLLRSTIPLTTVRTSIFTGLTAPLDTFPFGTSSMPTPGPTS